MFRQHLPKNAVDAGLSGNGFRGTPVISGDHRHFDTHFMQPMDNFLRLQFNRIRQRNQAGALPVDGKEHYGLARRTTTRGFDDEFVQNQFSFFNQLQVTQHDLFGRPHRSMPKPGIALNSEAADSSSFFSEAVFTIASAQRVFRIFSAEAASRKISSRYNRRGD